MAPVAPTIVVSPIGNLSEKLIDAVCREVRRVFGFATETVRLLDDVQFAFDPARRQYHSTVILERLAAVAPAQALKLIGVTREDLFIPILTYVYGEAQLGGRSAILSTYRLDDALPVLEGNKFLQARAAKEAIHELGHTFKLRHCKEKTCIMHYCRSIRDVDGKSDRLCRYCSVLLADEVRRLTKSG